MTTDADAILRAILEDPDDDALRLIYADALEDAGDAAGATFVRWSLAFAKLQSCDGTKEGCWCQACKEWPFCPPPPPLALQLRWPGDDMTHLPDFGTWRGLCEVWAVADVPAFEREAAAVFARHPIRRVVLRCEVGHRIARVQLEPRDPSACSRPLLDLLRLCRRRGSYDSHLYYRSPGLARADLEASLVTHGRRLAGLPDPAPR